MNYYKSELYFLLALLLGSSLLTFFIFKPFLYTLILAMIFVAVFAPVHKKMLALVQERRGVAALFTTTFMLLVILVPVTLLGTQIFKESTQLYSSLVNNGDVTSLSRGIEDVLRILGFSSVSVGSLDFSQYMKQGLTWLIQNLGSLFSNIAKILIDVFVLFIAMYYLFKDGHRLKKYAIALSPLQDVYDETIFDRLVLAVNSVVRGSLAVGLVQGTLTGIGFAIFGVPNPVLWGSVAALAALIPGVGTSLVLVPGTLFLFFSGATVSALGLLAWGAVAVGLVDNVLGPKLVERGMKIHPFLILLSILGGVGFFGPLGFLFGPLALSLLFSFLEIHAAMRKKQEI